MARGGFRPGMTGGGGKNQMTMMKQAQKMQADLLKMQEELESREFSATVGGGAVKAVVTGKRELLNIELSPDAVDPDDIEMLQDMLVAAVNEALRQAENAANENMSRLTGGLNLGF